MELMLDDQPCDVCARTVGEAIDAGAELAQTRGRLVVEVFVDGSPWNAEMLSSPDRFTAVAETVRLVTAEPRGLVMQTLQQAASALAEADDLQRSAAEAMQAGEHPESLKQLNEAISIWLSVAEAIVRSAQILGLSLDEIAVGEIPIIDSVRRLHDWLRVIHNALADRDQIGLADTLLYELPEVVGEWQAILAELELRVEAMAPAGHD